MPGGNSLLPPRIEGSNHRQQSAYRQGCRQSAQAFGSLTLLLCPLAFRLGPLFLRLGKRSGSVQLSLAFCLNLRLLGFTMLRAGVQELDGQIEVAPVPLCPKSIRSGVLLPPQGVLQIGCAPQGGTAALPQECGLLQTPVLFRRRHLVCSPRVKTFPLPNQALVADVEDRVWMQSCRHWGGGENCDPDGEKPPGLPPPHWPPAD